MAEQFARTESNSISKPPPAPGISPFVASKSLFIRRWGELSGYWGINRTMAEIHALLFVSNDPICMDDVMERLLISRGNASMNLRSLVDWGLIERVHRRGDRKEYFVCRTDVWQMFEIILQQRRRREMEPIIETIERCREMAKEASVAGRSTDPNGKKQTVETGHDGDVKRYDDRLRDMHEFLTLVGSLVDLVVRMGPRGLSAVAASMKNLTV